MGLSLAKEQAVAQKAPQLLSLVKSADTALDKSGLGGTVAKVALVLDYSGSMRNQYSSGAMQRLAEKVLALGVNLDDDGAIDFFVFDSRAAYLGEIGLDNYHGSVDRLTAGRRMGTTDYAGAFRAVRDHYGFSAAPAQKKGLFGFAKHTAPTTAPEDVPVYALFLTDGSPDSKQDAIAAITEVSSTPIFWKFLSIGNEQIHFLEKLDDLPGRFVDNANYHKVGNVDTISDKDLFDIMLDEYPSWLREVRAKGLIK